MFLKANFQPDGDVELWLVAWELEGKKRCIPVFCFPKRWHGKKAPNRYFFVYSAKERTTATQYEQLLVQVAPVNVSGDNDRPIIVREDEFTKVASRAPGITPLFYYRWDTDDPVQDEEPNIEANIKEDQGLLPVDSELFIRHLMKSCRLLPIQKLRFFWREVCRAMLDYLANKRMPIDFGVFKVTPLPYRINWKEIMHARFHWLSHHLTKHKVLSSQDEAQAHIAAFGFFSYLYHTDNVAWQPGPGCFDWTIELRPGPAWDQASSATEKARCQSVDPSTYLQHWGTYVRGHEAKALEALRYYFEKMQSPAAKKLEGIGAGGPRLMPHIPKGRVSPAPRISNDVVVTTAVEPGNTKRGKTQKPKAILLPQAELLQKMSLIRCEDENVRDDRPDVDQPSNTETRIAGLLVQHDGGLLGAGEGLLGSGDGSPS